MKKILLTLTTVVTILSFAGCGSVQNNTASNAGDKSTDSQVSKVEDFKITNADDALKKLKEGNEKFVSDKSELINVNSERRKELEDGQSPYAVVVSCADSRVETTHIFNAGLGEIFDIRIAGNVIGEDELGSIEYGAEHLGTPLVVIMGHENCGAVTAAYNEVKNNEKAEGNIEVLLEKIQPCVNESSDIEEASRMNVDKVVEGVKEDEIIKKLIEEGKVKVIGAYYNLDGTVSFFE